MRVGVFSAKSHDRWSLGEANARAADPHELVFLDARLVREEEESLFFEDHSADILQDDTFARLLTFPNVVVTGHQAFFTENALRDIARTTIDNVTAFERRGPLVNAVR